MSSIGEGRHNGIIVRREFGLDIIIGDIIIGIDTGRRHRGWQPQRREFREQPLAVTKWLLTCFFPYKKCGSRQVVLRQLRTFHVPYRGTILYAAFTYHFRGYSDVEWAYIICMAVGRWRLAMKVKDGRDTPPSMRDKTKRSQLVEYRPRVMVAGSFINNVTRKSHRKNNDRVTALDVRWMGLCSITC